MERILIHLHVFYFDQLRYYLKKVSLLRDCCALKVIVTCCADHPNRDDIEKNVLHILPEAEIKTVSNIGYDIYPFISVMKDEVAVQYDYILKLHTKGCFNNGYTVLNGVSVNDRQWTRHLVNSLIGSRKRFVKALKILRKDAEAGMAGSELCVIKDDPMREENYLPKINKLLKNMSIPTLKTYTYVAGTMFLAKAALFTPLTSISAEMFAPAEKGVKDGTFAHLCERLLGAVVLSQGTSIEKLKYKSAGQKLKRGLHRLKCSASRLLYYVTYRLKKRKYTRIISASGLFDSEWYSKRYHINTNKYKSCEEHYLLYGGFNGYNPSDNFSSAGYLKYNSDIKECGYNPLIHYWIHGISEGRQYKNTGTHEQTDYDE